MACVTKRLEKGSWFRQTIWHLHGNRLPKRFTEWRIHVEHRLIIDGIRIVRHSAETVETVQPSSSTRLVDGNAAHYAHE